MPRIDEASNETASDIVALTERAIGDGTEAFRFLKEIGDLLIKDSHGRTKNFELIVRCARRKAIKAMFTGNNLKEVAKRLGISIETVRNDVRNSYKKRV